MSYVVLARKWRPMTFDDLVGQDHVSRTLGNAIRAGRVAHAFLFTGVRGVGKTTSARILAKALNCMGPEGAPNDGPTVTPCQACAACREIAAGNDVDVREIDGASYNGVDEVRKLQDSLPYRPARDRYKIFIVDEVHMLSNSAWNAFLKTLEEPPPHVKFIFATTEVHKVPVTILSRVQRFDFKLIPTLLIAKRLKHVLATEGIASEDAALSIIAREAAGSMRDAMSLLDQVIAWNAEQLDAESVARVLGVASRKVLYDVANALVGGDAARCVAVVSELANQGYDIATVTRDLLALLRDVVVARVCKDPGDLLDLADEERADVLGLAARSDADDLVRLHQGFSAGYDDVVRSGNPRSGLEMLLVRLSRRPALIPIDDLVSRLTALEKRLAAAPRNAPQGPPPGPRGGGPPQGPPPGQRGGPPPRDDGRVGPSSGPPSGPPQRAQPREFRPAPKADGTSTEAPAEEPPRVVPSAPPAALAPSAPPPSRAAPSFAPPTAPPSAPSPLSPRNPPSFAPPSAPSPSVQSAPSTPGSAAPASNGPPSGHLNGRNGPTEALLAWRTIVQKVRETEGQLAAFLNHAMLVELTKEKILLGLESGTVFDTSLIRSPAAVSLLKAAAATHFGKEPEIAFEAINLGQATHTVAALDTLEKFERKQAALTRAKDHPRIAEVTQILGARLKEIRLPEE